MKPLLYATTAIGLIFSTFSPLSISDSQALQAPTLSQSGGPRYLSASPYEARRQQAQRPMLSQPTAQPEPQPIQLASAALPGSPMDMPLSAPAGNFATPSLIPVLPRTSMNAARPLYPSKAGTQPRPGVLPMPEATIMPEAAPQPQTLPIPEPQQQPAQMAQAPATSSPAPLMDMNAVPPAVLPLPDEMASAKAPVFKPYATIETQGGTMPERAAALPADASREQMRAQAEKQLREAEAFVDAMPAVAAASAAPTPIGSAEPAAPAVLPLPDDMASAKAAEKEAQKKQFLRSKQEARRSGLSEQTKQILDKIPSGLDAPKPDRNSKVAIKRYDPDVEGVLMPKQEAADEVASMEGEGVSIQVRRPSLDADAELERAYQALTAGDSELAIELYKEVAVAYPRNEGALFGLAATYHQIGRTDQARVYYDRLLRINPDHRDALNNFLVLVAEESPEEALHQMQNLERKNPDFSPIPAQMAIIYSKMGNHQASKAKMLRAIQISPDNLAYQYNLAIMMDQQGNYTEAAALYRKLIEASQRGAAIPTDVDEIEHRLVYIDSVRQN